MTKFEFTDALRRALSGRVSHSVVNENVAYYEHYIDAEMQKGRSEQEILEELGDPRWIAKTIIDTAKEEGAPEPESSASGVRREGGIRLPLWLAGIFLLLLVLLVFKVVGIVIGLVLPILLPVLLIYYLIRYFRNR